MNQHHYNTGYANKIKIFFIRFGRVANIGQELKFCFNES